MKKQKSHYKNSDAEFIGWQQTLSGNAFALYNIKNKNHPSCGSTVSEKTLNKMNLQYPKQPHSSGMENGFGNPGNETKSEIPEAMKYYKK